MALSSFNEAAAQAAQPQRRQMMARMTVRIRTQVRVQSTLRVVRRTQLLPGYRLSWPVLPPDAEVEAEDAATGEGEYPQRLDGEDDEA